MMHRTLSSVIYHIFILFIPHSLFFVMNYVPPVHNGLCSQNLSISYIRLRFIP